MKTVFYLVDVGVLQNLEWVPLTNLLPRDPDLRWRDETDFWFDLRLRQGLFRAHDEKVLWSVSAEKREIFERCCKEVGIELTEIDLQKEYDVYRKRCEAYRPSPLEEIPEEDRIEICSVTVPHIVCGPGTSQIFLEHLIGEKDNVRLYVHSNEKGRHHVPHCHVQYNDCKNYCVLSLVDGEKIEPDGAAKNAIVRTAQEILAERMQFARQKWNEIDSPLKFLVSDGQYTAEYR